MSIIRNLQHGGCVCLLLLVIYGYYAFLSGNDDSGFDPFEKYGYFLTWILFAPRIFLYFPLVFACFNFLGIICYHTFPEKPQLQRSPLLGPFFCFRVVTRGLFPELVRENVERNLQICTSVGLQNFMFEVVTDIPVNLPKNPRTRELVVPHNYTTRNGTLFKARALQYSLEPGVDILSDDDWIVHLDEETILTESSVIGTINFVSEGKHSFGQGVITYSKDKIVNWVTTLADSVRVGVDYGALRFSLRTLNKPFFSWKGSFIIANAAAEKHITFDHGPESSIAEDCFFAMMAFKEGYSFGFVEGEMWERSTFTLMDYIRQRRRWILGIYLTASSRKIPFKYKMGVILMSASGLSLPITTMGFIFGYIWPLPAWNGIHLILCSFLGTIVFLFMFGTMKSFSIRRTGAVQCVLLVIASLFCAIISSVLENVVAIMAWLPHKQPEFQIVKKDIRLQTIV
ncbi:beta-1,4-mannosyltransferase egh-like [Haliotis asinina]|uniref:beta-1,4-mannosyltransferase egh-like n=1 Tax=Haliotis asinina TaxID=109174 RepID=UPI0035326604